MKEFILENQYGDKIMITEHDEKYFNLYYLQHNAWEFDDNICKETVDQKIKDAVKVFVRIK